MEIALCFHVVVRRISPNITGRTGPNFAIYLPYESALRADDGSVLYFPICQGTLPWQPILCKNGAKLPTRLHLSLRHSETVWDNAMYVQD